MVFFLCFFFIQKQYLYVLLVRKVLYAALLVSNLTSLLLPPPIAFDLKAETGEDGEIAAAVECGEKEKRKEPFQFEKKVLNLFAIHFFFFPRGGRGVEAKGPEPPPPPTPQNPKDSCPDMGTGSNVEGREVRFPNSREEEVRE